MPWLWTDTLADLLDAIDRVPPEQLVGLRKHPIAHRLAEDQDAVALARRVLADSGRDPSKGTNPAPV